MDVANDWYEEDEVRYYLKTENEALLDHAAWITTALNNAFKKGKEVGHRECVRQLNNTVYGHTQKV